MLRPFLLHPHPCLATPAAPVAAIDATVRSLWDEMLGAMYAMPGVGLAPEGRRIPRPGAPTLHEGKVVGRLTSGGFGPSINKPIAMGYVPTELAHKGRRVEIDLGRARIGATVCSRMFVKDARY